MRCISGNVVFLCVVWSSRKWTAIGGFPDGNEQVNAYDDSTDFATTADGKLLLKVAHQPSMLEYTNSTFHRVQVTRAYTSSMLQTFNKFCFSHGLVELSAKLPGRAEQPGIWPAFWIFGNLGRAILKDSTDQLWPFSYDQCPDLKHAAANQAPQDAQRINACLSKDGPPARLCLIQGLWSPYKIWNDNNIVNACARQLRTTSAAGSAQSRAQRGGPQKRVLGEWWVRKRGVRRLGVREGFSTKSGFACSKGGDLSKFCDRLDCAS